MLKWKRGGGASESYVVKLWVGSDCDCASPGWAESTFCGEAAGMGPLGMLDSEGL